MIPLFWVLVVAAALFYPMVAIAYRRRLTYKRLDLGRILNHGKTFASYAKAFSSAATSTPDQTVDKLFQLYYAWQAYILPIVINVFVTGAACVAVLVQFGWSCGYPEIEKHVAAIPREAIAAIAGAFVWGAYDVLKRYETVDLSPVSLHYIWLRMLAAPALAPIAGIANDATKPLIGFAIGAFPLSSLLDFVKGQAKSKNISGSAEPPEAPTLNQLQGMTEGMLARLLDEGYEGVEHLANADPFKLLLKTNLDWKTVLDLIDQAILFDYVGTGASALRAIGIRGSIELATVQQLLDDKDAAVAANAAKLVTVIAGKLSQDESGVRNLIQNCFEDVQVNLLWDLWGDEEIKTIPSNAAASGAAA